MNQLIKLLKLFIIVHNHRLYLLKSLGSLVLFGHYSYVTKSISNYVHVGKYFTLVSSMLSLL